MPFAILYSPSCDMKAQLLAECDRCKVDLGRTHATLQRYRSLLSSEEVEDLLAFTDKTRAEAERTQQILNRHVVEHGCPG